MKIVGIGFRKPEARKLLKESPVGTLVVLKRDPLNEYDPNAVKAFLFKPNSVEPTLTQVGFVNKEDASRMSATWPEGYVFGAAILKSKNELQFKDFMHKKPMEDLNNKIWASFVDTTGDMFDDVDDEGING